MNYWSTRWVHWGGRLHALQMLVKLGRLWIAHHRDAAHLAHPAPCGVCYLSISRSCSNIFPIRRRLFFHLGLGLLFFFLIPGFLWRQCGATFHPDSAASASCPITQMAYYSPLKFRNILQYVFNVSFISFSFYDVWRHRFQVWLCWRHPKTKIHPSFFLLLLEHPQNR